MDAPLLAALGVRGSPTPGNRRVATYVRRARAFVAGTATRGGRRIGKLVALLR